VVGHLYLGVCDTRGVSTQIGRIFRSGSFIAPRSLQLCLSQPAQKTFLGGVLLTEFPQCGLECSHPQALACYGFRTAPAFTKRTADFPRKSMYTSVAPYALDGNLESLWS
jgi:hypothetical protein